MTITDTNATTDTALKADRKYASKFARFVATAIVPKRGLLNQRDLIVLTAILLEDLSVDLPEGLPDSPYLSDGTTYAEHFDALVREIGQMNVSLNRLYGALRHQSDKFINGDAA